MLLKPESLRVRLFVLVLIALLPAGGLALYDGLATRRREAARVTADALRVARLAAANQATLVEGAHQLLVALAQVPQVRASRSSACSQFMATLLSEFPTYANFGVIQLNGDVTCSGLPLSQPVNYADRTYFQRTLATGDFGAGDYQVGRITGRAGLNFGYPVRWLDGSINGVVYAALDLATVDELASQVMLPAGATVTVLDGNAVVLARYPATGDWVGRSVPDSLLGQAVLAGAGEGSGQGDGLDGFERLYAYTPVSPGDPHGAYIAIGVPVSLAFADLNLALALRLAALALVAALALAAAWFGAERFVIRPVRRLAGAAHRLAGGDLTSRTGLPHDPTELGQLASAFDQMAESLEGHEAEIRKLNAGLEMRVAERTAALESSNRELVAFSYSVSHDLRSPLRAIDGFSQALEEEYSDRLDEAGLNYLSRVRAATRRMGELIDDLLNLSRVSRQPMQPAQVDLSALAGAAAAELREATPEPPVEIRIAECLAANGDAGLLRVLLLNLLGNAWKFSGTQAQPRIEFGATAENGRPTFFVRDNGVGFDMRYADKLFGAFQRLHSTSEFPGTGIGLATAQRIVARHGGRIWAEAAVGQGATFYFTLGDEWPQENGHGEPSGDEG